MDTPTCNAGEEMIEMENTEFEDEDFGEAEDQEETIEPFDPKKVDVSISTPNLGTLIARLKHDEIDLMPDFQRSGDLWSKQLQSRLIESILIRLPIPAFYFDALLDDKWQVVDGLQRLSAINNFVIQKTLHLTKLEFLTDYDGCTYDELPRALQRRIEEFQTSVYLIKPGTPLLMKYSLFNRINTGGLKLNPQEIRHAMSQSVNSGAASKFLRDVVCSDEFKCVVVNKNYRMAHEELALRHFSFVIFGTESYKSSLPKFLNLGMIELGNAERRYLLRLKNKFLASLKAANDIFGKDSFKKSLAMPDHKKVVNKPLFESVSVSLSLINEQERSELVNRKEEVIKAFTVLLNDNEFDMSISKSTANTDNVQTRFNMINDTVKNLLTGC
ncbi:DUF262 domain-containing protein [Shewanella litoralis]|uniref:GmrSD restriction endonucleases N-terminal domain-containing protein n=1 Tax=Shewanella litoralis TaxID=2282700 RepID=A0ABQ2R763_9GAMM|nr:DUF262 domain-containing protein [Shewanella litoralis]GGQ17301.1 hypothetical protein GCM10009411_17110 [Shewanella litoralis]